MCLYVGIYVHISEYMLHLHVTVSYIFWSRYSVKIVYLRCVHSAGNTNRTFGLQVRVERRAVIRKQKEFSPIYTIVVASNSIVDN